MQPLASLYASHLQTLCARTDEALSATGFEALAIHAGRAPMLFLDDQPYPFKVNPHFKAWVPLLDAADCWIVYQPGKQPRLVFLQPVDYWHKPPAIPTDYWTDKFSIDVQSSTGFDPLTGTGTPPLPAGQITYSQPSRSGQAFGLRNLRAWIDGVPWPYAGPP